MIQVHVDGKHILKKLNINLSYGAAITPRSIPEKLRTYIHTKISTLMFLAALFITAMNEPQKYYAK